MAVILAIAGLADFGYTFARAAGLADQRGETFVTGGVKIWFAVFGRGTDIPLVVANGGPGFDHGYLLCSDAWDRIAARRRIVVYDQRGDGRSGPLPDSATCTLADQIADLEALRDHLGAARIDLLGHSWGGYLAMAYAARHPDRIHRLIICDSAAPRIQDTLFLLKNIYPETQAIQDTVAFAVELGDTGAIHIDLRAYMSELFYDPAARDAMLKRFSSLSYSQKVNRAVWGDLQRFDLNPELTKFRFPTLVITGRYDFNVAPSVAWAIHNQIRGSRFVVFEKSGHLPFCEQSTAFADTVSAFLER